MPDTLISDHPPIADRAAEGIQTLTSHILEAGWFLACGNAPDGSAPGISHVLTWIEATQDAWNKNRFYDDRRGWPLAPGFPGTTALGPRGRIKGDVAGTLRGNPQLGIVPYEDEGPEVAAALDAEWARRISEWRNFHIAGQAAHASFVTALAAIAYQENCPRCGTRQSATATYCYWCGAQLARVAIARPQIQPAKTRARWHKRAA